MISLYSVLSPIFVSFITFILTRKKYKTDVESTQINNLKSTLNFYITLVTDNNARIADYIKQNESSTMQVLKLKRVVYEILNTTCTDTSCPKRMMYPNEKLHDFLDN